MVQEMARKTANKMADQAVIDPQKIHIFAYGLELLYSSLAGVLALIIISAVGKKPFLWVPYLAGFVPLRLSGGGYQRIQPEKQSALLRRNTEYITTTASPWEAMLGATILITPSPRRMFAPTGITPIGLQLVMSLATHACTPEDNHG